MCECDIAYEGLWVKNEAPTAYWWSQASRSSESRMGQKGWRCWMCRGQLSRSQAEEWRAQTQTLETWWRGWSGARCWSWRTVGDEFPIRATGHKFELILCYVNKGIIRWTTCDIRKNFPRLFERTSTWIALLPACWTTRPSSSFVSSRRGAAGPEPKKLIELNNIDKHEEKCIYWHVLLWTHHLNEEKWIRIRGRGRPAHVVIVVRVIVIRRPIKWIHRAIALTLITRITSWSHFKW